MNYETIAEVVKGYLHRDDLDFQIGVSIILANQRIGRDLRDKSNVVSVSYNPTTAKNILPADYSDMRDIFHNGKGLGYMTAAQLAQHQAAGGSSDTGFYTIEGRGIQFSPAVSDSVQLVYFQVPTAPVAGTDENPVMIAHPQLYVYGALVDLFFITQDGDLAKYAESSYEREIAAINSAYASAPVGSSPAMRRIY